MWLQLDFFYHYELKRVVDVGCCFSMRCKRGLIFFEKVAFLIDALFREKWHSFG